MNLSSNRIRAVKARRTSLAPRDILITISPAHGNAEYTFKIYNNRFWKRDINIIIDSLVKLLAMNRSEIDSKVLYEIE